jgi:defect in organelle trafficking protein DotB
LTALTFKRFLKYCADNGASDILIQGGDYVWVEIHGRQRRASTHTIKQVHTESVAETVNRIIQVYPPAQQSAVASRLIGALRVIVVQRLLKSCDGRRKAIREYVVFDRGLRNELQSVSYEQWGPMLRERLECARATLDDKAWCLYRDGQIAKAEFVELAGAKTFNARSKEQS